MIDVPLIPPLPQARVNRTEVSAKDPHHENEKRKKQKKPEEIEDTIILHSDENNKESPPTPLSGHIDFEA
jgi:hypothetical protein